ncbi:MAG: nodulation protein NfeD [Dehalococcoidia bacterium]|nr:nodulation protein NfeD [Dehalococcoidia bacterium]
MAIQRRVPLLRRPLLALSTVLIVLGAVGIAAPAGAQESHVLVASVDGMINPVTQRYISRTIERGEKDGARLVVIKLNTPGGLLDSTRKIVEDLLNAQVPTAVYVEPSGAHAASAGTFVTAAANFAVMAPGTNIGAAAPVASGGEDIPETLQAKVVEDTAALMRTIAQQRDRNSEKLEDTVRSAIAYDATEAVELEVVDFIADDLTDLLQQVHGRTAETGAGTVMLDTRGVVLRETNMNIIERFLSFLAHPDIAFLLLSLGGLGLAIELFNPGVIIPGVVGVILVLLAFLSFGNLPVNWAAVGFIGLALALLIAEVFVAGFGILGIGSIVAFVIGGLLLFSSFGTPSPTLPDVKVNLWLIVGLTVGFTLAGLWFYSTVVQSRRAAKSAGPTILEVVGATGVATSDLDPQGTVHVHAEEWTATSEGDTFIENGQAVRVLGVDGTLLTVAPVDEGTR